MSKKRSRGLRLGDWVTVKRLDSGGNADVYAAKNSQGVTGAIKVLRRSEREARSRFCTEVEIVRKNPTKGVLPILDCSVPEESDSILWYVMPLATPALKALKDQDAVEIVKAIVAISETLAELHGKGISHRDIKPANLLKYNNTWCIGDFGLVDFPDKDDLTDSDEAIGPRWTMAPEMRRDAPNADGKPADVYSLAKTLWILLTKETKGFEGQYAAQGMIRLGKYASSIYYTTPLDDLLHKSTDNNPADRPSMSEFHAKLKEWLRVNADYEKQNRLQWREAQEKLFPAAIPKRVIWESIGDIVTILNLLGSIPQLNHMFYPDGGGMDLKKAELSTMEEGCIEMYTGFTEIVKPKRLLFESFGDDTEWNYFRLECRRLTPSKPYAGRSREYEAEEVVELEPGVYIDRRHWDKNEYKGEPLPSSARLVVRHTKGSFVVFQKTSIYNRNPDTYDGRHNKVSAN
jgi:hypothetical protein